MGIPQIIIIFFIATNLLISANKHGKPKPDCNFFVSLIDAIVMTGLLIWGGFFN